MQWTIVILRPIIVKTGLGRLFEKILRVNNMYIVKKHQRMLTPAEATLLCKMEGINAPDWMDTYKKIMLEGPVEIYLLSKIGAVAEARAIVDGCMRGWKWVSQKNEDETDANVVQRNMDSESSAFQVTPFSSLNELIDVEDFILYHSNI